MLRSYKVNSIIISRRNIGEADKILTLFTAEFGKKVVIAKGIRRSTSRRAPHLELFTHCEVLLHRGKTFDIVTEVQTFEAFIPLRKKLERIGFVYIALELISRLTAEHQEAPQIFTKLLTFLHTLNHHATTRTQAKKALTSFKQFLLEELGFAKANFLTEENQLDDEIERIIETKLKSPKLLTRIQSL